MDIRALKANDDYLPRVMALGRANTETLGFLPDGAFEQHAEQGTILAASDDLGVCIGYLLYRVANSRAMITHLCVHNDFRHRGVARELVNSLNERTQHVRGVGLYCRRDYVVHSMWPKLGFSAISEKKGRSVNGSELTFWWLDHNHPTLFSDTNPSVGESVVRVVIDANVFFDLIVQNLEESAALRADWLQEYVRLCVTDEIYNEIDRNQHSADERRKLKGLVSHFTEARHDQTILARTQTQLQPYFPETADANTQSDLRQIAKTIAANVRFFVTRDQDLLNMSDKIEQSHGVRIIRPSDLILHIDELKREAEYQPASLAGTQWQLRRVQSGEQNDIVESLYRASGSEKKYSFKDRLRTALASPDLYECDVAIDPGKGVMALIVLHRNKDKLEVPLFRVQDIPLGATIARYLASRATLKAAEEKREITIVTDTSCGALVLSALQENGFLETEPGWAKINIGGAMSSTELVMRIRAIGEKLGPGGARYGSLASRLIERDFQSDGQTMAEMERTFWPVKITDAALPTFIIPIRPHWAQHLFDERLANQTLFGAEVGKALNLEAVYYRAAKRTVRTPGRILWYVSSDSKYQGAGKIRACSSIEEIAVGRAKDLYKRFQRLGIYEWHNILDLAHRDPDRKIMAVRFSNTVLLSNPIPWKALKSLLAEEGKHAQIQSAFPITGSLFAKLYTIGIRDN